LNPGAGLPVTGGMRFVRPPPAMQRGFSLIELVAAFVVFALGFGALMQILTGSVRNARLSYEYTQAALWAQTKLDTAGVGQRLEEGVTRGSFNDAYRWEMQVAKFQPADSEAMKGVQGTYPVDLFRIDLEVHWGARGQERTAHFGTLRAANPDLGGNGPSNPAMFPLRGTGERR